MLVRNEKHSDVVSNRQYDKRLVFCAKRARSVTSNKKELGREHILAVHVL